MTETSKRPIALGIGAGLGFGTFFALIAQTPDDAGAVPLVAARATSVTILIIAVVVTRPGAPAPQVLGVAIVAGALDMAANGLFLWSTLDGDLAIVGALVSLFPATTVLLAVVFLGERLDRKQIAASLSRSPQRRSSAHQALEHRVSVLRRQHLACSPESLEQLAFPGQQFSDLVASAPIQPPRRPIRVVDVEPQLSCPFSGQHRLQRREHGRAKATGPHRRSDRDLIQEGTRLVHRGRGRVSPRATRRTPQTDRAP